MSLTRRTASFALAVGLSLILFGCPDRPVAETPVAEEEAEPSVGEKGHMPGTDDEELTADAPRFVHTIRHPVILTIPAAPHSYGGQQQAAAAGQGATRAPQQATSEGGAEESSDGPACTIGVSLGDTNIQCDAKEDPRLYEAVRWCVVLSDGAPEAQQVCIEHKSGPDIFREVPFCIELAESNCVEARPDCDRMEGDSADWEYRVVAKAPDGTPVCTVNPPVVHTDRGG